MKRSLHAFKLKIMILRKEERKQRLGMIHKQNESLSKTSRTLRTSLRTFQASSAFTLSMSVFLFRDGLDRQKERNENGSAERHI